MVKPPLMKSDLLEVSDEAVSDKTGRTWPEWEAYLDRLDAEELTHKQIVALLRDEIDSGWWRQMVTNGYEKLKGRRKVGQTQDGRYQIGVQRTLPLHLDAAWERVMSANGRSCWLGAGADFPLQKGVAYELEDGSQGEVRVFEERHHVRITRRPSGWARASTIQVRFTPKDDRTTISFHEENLPSQKERELRRTHYQDALTRLLP